MSWKKKKTTGSALQAPPGYRDSGLPIFSDNEVVGSAYQIRRLLGSGSAGQVYEAWDMTLQRLVTLKASWRDEGIPSLLEEARAFAAVDSDCVADVYAVSKYHDVEYLVMQAISGRPLRELLRKNPKGLRLEDALELLISVCDGLDSVHGAGFAHRNLIIDTMILMPAPDCIGRIVFSGIGLLPAGRKTARADFPVPELVQGQSADAKPVDVYALGNLAVELFTGRPPYASDNLRQTLDAHVLQPVPSLVRLREDVPVEVSDLVGELMAKDPNGRPERVRDIAAQFRVALLRLQMRGGATPVRALVVDHDSERVRALWSVLRRAHASIEIDAARTGQEAIERLAEESVRLLVVSLDMPGSMNGVELCMYLQGTGLPANCKIIAVNDEIKPADRSVLEQLGVSQVLSRSDALKNQLPIIVRGLVR